ncbi:MAG: amidohydrolase [Anaerolineaceae bacterium]|nr:amidohydrolase [Anaerolineaceae bacterium]
MTKPIIFTNGRIYQGKGSCLSGQSLLVQGSLICSLGPLSELRSLAGEARELDMQGGLLLPGLVDSHLHLAQLAYALQSVDCEIPSKKQLLERVRMKALCSAADWVIGYGWNQNSWNPPEFGSAEELDAASEGKAVVLFAKSLHALWANTRAMQLAGVNAGTPNPLGGAVLRNENGEPTGIFLENAMQLMQKAIPEASAELLEKCMDETQAYLFSMGITAVHDFDRFESYEALVKLEKSERLHLRVAKSLPAAAVEQIQSWDYRSLLSTKHLRPGWVKAFADGALGPQSAAMLAPYEGSQAKGMLLISKEEILELGIKAHQAGWPLAVHAIGDAANHEVIEGYKLLRAYEAGKELEPLLYRIEHVQCMTPQDQELMKSLGIIASVQPIHAASDMFTAEKHWGARCEYAYAYRSLLNKGIPSIYGSDAPVEPSNPFLGLHAAVSRRKASGEPGEEGWYPKQRLSLAEALDGFSFNANAVAGFADATAIAPGQTANLLLLKEDLFTLDPQQIAAIKPLMTLVEGEVRFEA